MTIKKTLLITLGLLIVNGCSATKQGHFTSQVGVNASQLNASITQDMVNFIENYYPLSTTTFYFQLDPTAYKQGEAIEDALRNVGYGVSYIKKKGRVPFAYKIDFIDEDIMRATYNIGSSTLSRLYSVDAEQSTPLSAFTTRGFSKRISSHLNPIDTTSSNDTSLRKAMVSIPALNIRNKPSSQGKIVGQYKKNALIFVEPAVTNSVGEQWCRVISTNKHKNPKYIASRYIHYVD